MDLDKTGKENYHWPSMKMPARMRVLLFEDNADLRSMLQSLLVENGWEVVDFMTPHDCPLRHSTGCMCEHSEVCSDVIVTDFEMPTVDGVTFLHDLVKVGCKVPYMAVFTGCEDSTKLQYAKDSGFVVFEKPRQLSELLAWLKGIESQLQDARRLTPLTYVSGEAGRR